MKASRSVGWMLACVLMASGCRRPVGAPLPPGSTCRRNNASVTLGPGDRFSIRVYGQENLSGEYRVNEDGTIDFPYLHTVHVEDRTASRVAEEIGGRLGSPTDRFPDASAVLRNPNVSVTIIEVTSRRVSVFGQVQHPGVFPHQQCLTVTQVISLAGGFTQLAEQNQVRVTRRPRESPDGGVSTQPRTFVLRVEDIAEGRAPDFDLEPGDVIFVPESVT